MNSNLFPALAVRFAILLVIGSLAVGWAGSAGVSAADPTGVWRGEWRSASTGHKGPMRVAIRPAGNGTYQARFSGRFLVVIPFMYRATLIPSRDAYGNVVLSSTKKLGFGLGNYTMQTAVVGNRLQGGFSAAKDRGTVSKRRVR